LRACPSRVLAFFGSRGLWVPLPRIPSTTTTGASQIFTRFTSLCLLLVVVKMEQDDAYSRRGIHSMYSNLGQAGRPSTPLSPFADPPSLGATPYSSRPPSTIGSSSALRQLPQRYFHSRRVRKGEVEKPWLQNKDPREKWITIIPLLGILLGLGVAGFLVYDGLRTVVNHKYCPVLSENFSSGKLDSSVWTKEVEVGGYG